MKKISILLLYCVAGAVMASAEELPADNAVRPSYVALKNNLLYDAAATPNLQLEFRLAEHWSLQAGAGFNPFPLNDEVIPKWRHVSVELAPRYWLCQTFTRDFVSLNAAYVHYNVAGGMYPIGWMYKAVRDSRFQGDAVMFGASYGWQFAISPHFSIELEGGVDAGVTWYEQFKCKHCGEKLAQDKKWFVLPRLGVNLVVLLDGNDEEHADRCDCGKLQPGEPVPASAENETVTEAPDEAPIEETPEESVVDTIINSLCDTVILMQNTPADTLTEAEPELVTDTLPKPDTLHTETESPAELRKQIKMLDDAYADAPSDSLYDAITALVHKQDEQAHMDQLSRLRAVLLRPIEEFAPYDPTAMFTRDPNSIYMHFDVSCTKVDGAFLHNDELMDSIVHVIADALQDTTIEIRIIKIVGMASFDGSQKLNNRLAASRGEALRAYIQEQFGFSDSMFRVYNGGECWTELRWYLEHEEFPGKSDILSIIDQVPDYDQRERYIKEHCNGQTYEYMRTHFKRYLRNLGTITVYYAPVEKQ